MFTLIAILSLVYAVLSAYSEFPSSEQVINEIGIQNDSIAMFLDLNLTELRTFAGIVPLNNQVLIEIKCKKSGMLYI